MPMTTISYQEARDDMGPGDVIAFGGKTPASTIIKWATRSVVSHVGVILQTGVRNDASGRFFNQIIESTSLNGFDGVSISRFSDRLKHYDGEIWWLPLDRQLRQGKFDQVAFYDFLFEQEGKSYDLVQALGSEVDALEDLPFRVGYNREDFSKFFCSELVAAGLEKAGSVGRINASEVTPIDLCRWHIYHDDYYQLKGDRTEISRYNTANPADWSG